jgi:DNA-binding CsgD family transcriptional regulator/tetratricopeptide (TPR) repeat protein
VAQYERALRYAEVADPAFVASLYDRLGSEGSLVDRWQESADARRKALALWRQVGDPLREGNTLRLLSRTMWRLCEGAEAVSFAERALEVLRDLPPGSELAWAYANLAHQRMLDADAEGALELAATAVDLAERLDLPAVLSDALNTGACASSLRGKPWEGDLHRALEVALAAGRQEQAGRAYANLCSIGARERRFVEFEPDYTAGQAYCDLHDITTFATCLRGQRANNLEQQGRWDEAVTLARTLLARRETSPINRLNPSIALGRILARRGDPDGTRLIEEAAGAAERVTDASWMAEAYSSLAEAAGLEGRAIAAVEAIQRAGAAATACDPWTRGQVEVWRHRLGLPATRVEGIAEPYALELAGDLLGAAELWSGLGCPYLAALALSRRDDEESLRRALSGLEQLGAVATAAATRRRMRQLGVKAVPTGPRAATRQHEFRLTRREQEVLALMAEGMANAEISQRLFISERTVDHHVSAVLGKMDVRSRAAAARKAIRAGIVDARL